jgi:CHAT domain-containing protein/predicted negative regulator of RcsB-dependent stress response
MLPDKRRKPYRKQLLVPSLIASCCLSLFALGLPETNPVSTATNSTTINEVPNGEGLELMAQADALLRNWQESDLRKSLAKYDQAALLLTSIGDDANALLAKLKAASVYFHLSEFAGALERYQSVVAEAEKRGDRLAQGRALGQIARVESYMGNNDLAQQHVNQALSLLKPAENDSSPLVKSAYGEALASACEVSYAKGNFVKALDQCKEALGYLEQDLEVQARARRFIGYLNGSLGNLAGVEPEVVRALELSRSINDKSGEGLALTLLGLFYSYKGNFNRGVELHREALDIFRSSGDRHSQAVVFNGLGQSYQVVKQYETAIVNFEKALKLLESTGSLDLVAVNAHSLAKTYLDAGKHEQALKYLDRSLMLSRAAGKRRSEANALSEIALVYVSQDRPDDAARQFREVQEFYRTNGDGRGHAIALNTYGDFLFNAGKNQEALNAYNEALPLSEKVEDNEVLTKTLFNLARAYQSLGDYERSLSHIERSLKIIEDLRAGVGTPDLRVSYFSGVQKHYELCRDILMQLDRAQPGRGFAERAFLASDKSKARSLVDLVTESRSELRDGVAVELLAREREVGISITRLAEYKWELALDGKANSDEATEVASRLAELNADYQEIKAELRKRSLKRSSLADFKLENVAQVQKLLQGSDTMVLEYSLGDKQSYLWTITSNSFQTYELPGRKTIEDAAGEFLELTIAPQKLAEIPDGDYQAKVQEAIRLRPVKARELSRMLLGQVAEQLGSKTLVFVTEGALQLAPLESLPPPGSPPVGPGETEKTLWHNHEIARLPSVSTLLAQRAAGSRSASTGRIVAVIADPVYSSNDDRVAGQGLSPAIAHKASLSSTEQPPAQGMLRGGSPARLVHSAKEADTISALAPRGTAMIARGFDASRETAMSSRIGEYQIIHFATHGFVDNKQPELSGIVLSLVDQNGTTQNGIMPLHDIYSLNLSAELTVLSACETALGEDVKGEGLVGLTHSFMSAGSKSVVASLWKVDDRATAVLMSHFYKSMFEDGLRPAAALRAAQLKMMQDKQWNAPHYWAGFVFQGDYESRIRVGSSKVPIIVAILFVVLLLSGLLLFMRRRRRSSPAATNLS